MQERIQFGGRDNRIVIQWVEEGETGDGSLSFVIKVYKIVIYW